MTGNIRLVPGQHVHLIGIGGTGMSAIARILLRQGFKVSGSDRSANATTAALKDEGAIVHIGHDATYVNNAEMIIATSAVPDSHIEIMSAQAQGIPVYRRSDVMAAIMQGHTGIAIAGTHGKTTTTSMVVHVLTECDQSPTYIVGGVMENMGTNADVGTGRAFVIEADEYDNMFHGLRPEVEVVTSVEYDHPDFFQSPAEMVNSFSYFVGLLPDTGLFIACADDPTAMIFAHNRQIVHLPTYTYGIEHPDAMWRAVNIHDTETTTCFDVKYDEAIIAEVELQVPGRHNILNAMAALIVAHHEGVDLDAAATALAAFEGAGRRFDVRLDTGSVAIVDDYAHHPSAIRVTIDAAKKRYPQREVWAVWQPHTYSRTEHLWDAFLDSFDAADHVIVTDIYASREAPNPDVNSADFVAALAHERKFHAPEFDDAVAILQQHVTDDAVILIMSAGDAPEIGERYRTYLETATS